MTVVLYLLLIPVGVVMLWEFRHLLALRKHDRVLFPLCQIRRELGGFLRDHASEMSREDYVYARQMLTAVNHTVSIYRDHRTRFFNFRAFLRFLRAYNKNATEIQRVPRTERPELQAIEQRLNAAMLRGFMCYTPFMRSEFAARLLVGIVTVLGRMGIRAFSNRTREWRELIATTREQMDHMEGLTAA